MVGAEKVRSWGWGAALVFSEEGVCCAAACLWNMPEVQ